MKIKIGSDGLACDGSDLGVEIVGDALHSYLQNHGRRVVHGFADSSLVASPTREVAESIRTTAKEWAQNEIERLEVQLRNLRDVLVEITESTIESS